MVVPLEMGWRHLLFENWPVAADIIDAHLPDSLTVDEHDGTGWLSVVPFTNAPFGLADPLARFLVERYRFYTEATDGTLRYTNVDHESWTLYPATATVETNTLLTANGFAHPDAEPVYYYSPGLDVTASRNKRWRTFKDG